MATILRDSVVNAVVRTYALASNTASHDNHEKINSWFPPGFPFLSHEYRVPLTSRVRIESTREVPQTNRLTFVVMFQERGRFMYHYFTGLNFRWSESSRIVMSLR